MGGSTWTGQIGGRGWTAGLRAVDARATRVGWGGRLAPNGAWPARKDRRRGVVCLVLSPSRTGAGAPPFGMPRFLWEF